MGFPPRWLQQSINKNEEEVVEEERAESGKVKAIPCVFRKCSHRHTSLIIP